MLLCLKRLCFAIVLSLCLGTLQVHAESGEKILFCKTLSADFVPSPSIEQSETATISWYTILEKPFGVLQVTLSFYENIENNQQDLLERVTIDVNPEWNAYGIRNFTFPDNGEYTLSFTKLDGTPIASGTILIQNSVSDEKTVTEEPIGKTLADIFNQFKNK